MDRFLNAANVIVCTLGVISADTVLGGAGSAITGGFSFLALKKTPTRDAGGLSKSIAGDLETALSENAPGLPDEADRLIPQMIEDGALTPVEIHDARRDPERICQAMLAKLTDSDQLRSEVQSCFHRIVGRIFEHQLNDPKVCDQLRPVFERALLEQGVRHEDNQIRFGVKLDEVKAQFKTDLGKVIELLGEQATRRSAADDQSRRHLDALIRHEEFMQSLAKGYLEVSPGEVQSAINGMKAAILQLTESLAAADGPREQGDWVDEYISKINELHSKHDLAQARQQIETAKAEARRRRHDIKTEHRSILDQQLVNARLIPDPGLAADAVLEQLEWDGVDFRSVMQHQQKWFQRGQSQGVKFDIDVSVALAQYARGCAETDNEKLAALYCSAMVQAFAGGRYGDAAALARSVEAAEGALGLADKAQAPADWAAIQGILGNAYLNQARAGSEPSSLDHAERAFEAALSVMSSVTAAEPWAANKNSLGLVHLLAGERQKDAERLRQALSVFTGVLGVIDHDTHWGFWAAIKRNIGKTLISLAVETDDRQLLEDAQRELRAALDACEAKPLEWASTQELLAIAERELANRTQGDAQRDHLDKALEHIDAALTKLDRHLLPRQHSKAAALREKLMDQRSGM